MRCGFWVAHKTTVLVGLTNCTVCVQSLRLACNVWMSCTLHGAFVGFARRHQSCQHALCTSVSWIRATLGGMRFAHACRQTSADRLYLSAVRVAQCTRIWWSSMKLQTPTSQPKWQPTCRVQSGRNKHWVAFALSTKQWLKQKSHSSWMSRVFPGVWIEHGDCR